VFNANSQMAVYGAGPHGHGNMVSYALWMKTTSEEDMALINTGRAGLKGLMNLHLNDGAPELLIADNERLVAKGQKLDRLRACEPRTRRARKKSRRDEESTKPCGGRRVRHRARLVSGRHGFSKSQLNQPGSRR